MAEAIVDTIFAPIEGIASLFSGGKKKKDPPKKKKKTGTKEYTSLQHPSRGESIAAWKERIKESDTHEYDETTVV